MPKIIQMKNISEHISYNEATFSQKAIKLNLANNPNEEELRAMQLVAEKVFEPLRKYINQPIRISSFFRSEPVNKAVGGSRNSQHKYGQAIDIQLFNKSKFTNADLFNYIKENLDFDQLIWEFGSDAEPDWVHVSYKASENRKKLTRAIVVGGKNRYIDYVAKEADANLPEDKSLKTSGVVAVKLLNIREEPNAKAQKVSEPLSKGTLVEILDEKDGWYRVKTSVEGWMAASYID